MNFKCDWSPLLCNRVNKLTLQTNVAFNFLEAIEVSEKEQQGWQVCANNWVRQIAGVKRVGLRRLNDLRKELYIEKGKFAKLDIQLYFRLCISYTSHIVLFHCYTLTNK